MVGYYQTCGCAGLCRPACVSVVGLSTAPVGVVQAAG